MDVPTPPPAAPSDAAEDTDLYCLSCGYNLRGLSGDPRRCPECFAMNLVDETIVPPEAVERVLHSMESAPALGALFAAVMLFATAVLADYVFVKGVAGSPPDLPCFVVLLLASVAGFAAVTAVVRARCAARPGWRKAYLRYQVAGTALLILTVLAAAGVAALNQFIGVRIGMRYPSVPRALLQSLSFAAVTVAASVAARRWIRRVRDDLNGYQRDGAVRLAREQLRAERGLRRSFH